MLTRIATDFPVPDGPSESLHAPAPHRTATAPRSGRVPFRTGLLVTIAVLVLVTRAAFLPGTLEDIDSVNFAMAIDNFDPRLHQPHPPGYPVYIALVRAVHALFPDPPRAMGLLSAIAQAALVFPLFALMARLASSPLRAVLAALLTLACPVLWFNGARPMSDSVGLFFVVASQALLLRSLQQPRALPWASLLAGIALGVRLQTGLLTLPLWLFAMARQRTFRAPALSFAAGSALWAIPLVIASGGILAYVRAFVEVMGDAAGSEPVMVAFTLNRAAQALVDVLVAPWVLRPLGIVVSALALVGVAITARRSPMALGLSALAFLPYFLVHSLVQQVETVRYSLPYLPWIAWLAVEGLGFLVERLPRAARLEQIGFTTLALISAALTIPALALYHALPSPPYAALQKVERMAADPDQYVLAGHYMFSRYLDLRPAGLEVLPPVPGKSIERLGEYFRTGGDRRVLFLADPRRTDLGTFSRDARRRIGRWEWPSSVKPFMAGERPNAAELFEIEEPRFLSSEGWLLSLESGRLDTIDREPHRVAYLKPMPEASFLLLAGSPTRATPDCTLDVAIPGLRLDRTSCRAPILRGYRVPPVSTPEHYLRLSASTLLNEEAAGAPFALNGLDYGPGDAAGFVHGFGWHYPEKDEHLDRFRWASPNARTLLHIPAGGARLVIEGMAPLEYLGKGLEIRLSEKGATLASERLSRNRFRLVAEFEADVAAFREVALTSERGFVPDLIQQNGDLRTLALRVYEFTLEPTIRPAHLRPAGGTSPRKFSSTPRGSH